MQKAAVLYLDEADGRLWEQSFAAVSDLARITAAGDLSTSLETLREIGPGLRVVAVSARLYPEHFPDLARKVREACPKAEILLISGDDAAPPLKPLFEDRIRHLAISPAGPASGDRLAAVIAMLVEHRPWEMSSCLKEGTRVHSFPVGSSEDKELLIQSLENLLSGEGEEMEILRQKGALLADELFENAMYNAPRGALGDRLFSKGERRSILPREQIMFSFAFDGETLALNLTDNWGTLQPDQVLEYLSKNEAEALLEDDGGRGLFIVWRFLDQFHVDVRPGRSTAVGGHLQLSSRLDLEAPRGFHITNYEEAAA